MLKWINLELLDVTMDGVLAISDAVAVVPRSKGRARDLSTSGVLNAGSCKLTRLLVARATFWSQLGFNYP